MKINFLIVIPAAAFALACNSKKAVSLEQRSQDSVKAYLMRHLNDPASYQPVNFDLLQRQVNSNLQDDQHRLKQVIAHIKYRLYHTFRATDGIGALEEHKALFELDSAFRVVDTEGL